MREPSLGVRALWLATAKAIAFALAFGLPLVLVRRLDQTEFGIYKQVFLLVGTITTALPLGFVMSAYYFLTREPERRGTIVLNIALFYAAIGGMSALAILAFPGVLGWLFNAPVLITYAPLVAAVVVLSVCGSWLEIIMIANQEARLAAVVIVALEASKAVLLVAAALITPSVTALLWAALLYCGLQTVAVASYLGSRFPGYHARFDAGLFGAQIGYALPLGLGGLLWWAQMEAHHYFVSNAFGPTVFAIYAIGCLNLPLVNIVNDSVGSVLIPRVSALLRDGDRDETVRVLAAAIRKVALLYLPLYAFLLVAGRDLIVVMFTRQYEASWPIFATYVNLVPLSILAVACDAVIRAHADLRYVLLRVRIPLAVFLLGGLWLATRYGTPLAAVGVVVGLNLVERIVIGVKVSRVLELRATDAAFFTGVRPIVVASAGAAVAALAARTLLGDAHPFMLLVGTGAVFGSTFVAIGAFVGILDASEIGTLRRRLTLRASKAPGTPAVRTAPAEPGRSSITGRS